MLRTRWPEAASGFDGVCHGAPVTFPKEVCQVTIQVLHDRFQLLRTTPPSHWRSSLL